MSVAVLLVAVAAAAAAAVPAPGSDWFGSLKSPNFPEPYPAETLLRWNLSVPDGLRLKLDFSHFDLEPSYMCEYDYVKVEAEGEVLGLFCGRDQTDTEAVPDQRVITSPANSLSVIFSSDFSNEERHSGFVAHYRAEDVDECSERSDDDLICDHFCHNYIGGFYCSCRHGYQLHTDRRTCTVGCSDVFRERWGSVSSVDFPSPYPKSLECVYRIEVEPGFKLRLQFDPSFDVEDHPDVHCPYDYVKITAGHTELGPFCGSTSPGVLQTLSNNVSIVFHSDDSGGENSGWKITYTATGSECPVPETLPNVVMTPVQSEYSFKDHIHFSCSPGYRLVKDGQNVDEFRMDCGPDGQWSSGAPSCQLVDCGRPKAADMAELVFGHQDNRTHFGSTVHYVCRRDVFDRNSSNVSYSCGQDGQWTNPEFGDNPPVCVSACGRPSRAPPPQVKRIVGGRRAESGLFPWHVLLSVEDRSRVPEDRWFGSGALVSGSWVLTAAHVLRSRRRDAGVIPVAPEDVKVFLGLHDARDKRGASNRSVQQIVLHPDFQANNYNNDVALLKLSEGAEFSDIIRPVCLPPPHRRDDLLWPPPHSMGAVAGWGISLSNASGPPSPDSDPGTTSDLLQYVKLPVVPQDECRASYASRSLSYNITDNMFCAGFFEGGRDTCLGDSGGAFVVEDGPGGGWTAAGLVSWGGPEECGTQRVYGVYTRLAKYAEWMRGHLRVAPWWPED